MANNKEELIEEILVIEDKAERQRVLREHPSLIDADLVRILKSKADHALRDDTPKALDLAESALLISEMLDDPASFALSLRAKAQALHMMGQLGDSLEVYDKASETYANNSEEIEATRTLIGKIDALVHLSRYDEALVTADQCRAVFSANNEPLLEAKVLMNQGNIYHRLDRYTESLELYEGARDMFESQDEPLLVALAETNLGNSYSSAGRFGDALDSYQRAGSVYRDMGLKAGLAMNDSNQGYLNFLKGEYNEALGALRSARRTFEDMKVPRNVATVDLDTAEVYAALNLKERALGSYDSALEKFQSMGFASEAARGLLGKAIVHIQMSEQELATQELSDAREYFEKEDNQVHLGLVELHQAILLRQSEQFEQALELAEHARERFASQNLLAKTAYAKLVIGDLLLDLARDSEAIEQFEQALEAGESTGLPWMLYESHAALGRAYRQNRPDEARIQYAQAIEALERTRMSLRPEELKTAFIGNKLDVYGDMISLCIEKGTDEGFEEAFKYVERSKSQALLDMLAGEVKVTSTDTEGADAKLAERLSKLREELDSYYSVVDQYEIREGPRALPIIQGMRTQIVMMESEFSELLGELQLESGNAASMHHPISVDRSQLTDILQDDVAMIEYFILGNSISAFVMAKDEDIQFFPDLATTAKIDTIARKLQFQLDKVSYGEAAIEGLEDQLMRATLAYLGQLHNSLIAPLQTALKEKLVIIPHGALHNLPFHAFHDGEAYLIDSHEITFAPSASVLRYCWDKETAPVRKPLAIGVGDPAIPQAAKEAASVASLFPESTLLIEEAATQEQLENLIAEHDALHLASHATFSEENPAFSRIKMEGGWLTLDDIYNLDLGNSSLVTLSACETGVSSPNAGDELVGLTRGFFYAGTPSLVVSLWKVNDEVTTVLMQEFYTRLRDGKTKATALREAMLTVKEDRPHPYFWAPFVLSGKSV